MLFVDLKKQYERIETGVKSGLDAVLEHGKYIMGPEIGRLESTLAQFVGAKHAIAVSSGTDAILMALLAADIGPGDEVITTPFSFFATAEVIALTGARAVFVDICPQTYNINPSLIEAVINENTRAILPVSLYGQCASMTEINQIALNNNLIVIEDAAQSFGASHHGRRSCGLSKLACTSFFPSKPLGAYGDGGACFTDDDALAEQLLQIRDHGQSSRYHHIRLGINGRMDSFQAAVLLQKLTIFEEEVALRQAVAGRYDNLLDGIVKVPHISDYNQSVYAQYTIEVGDREQVQTSLSEMGIPTAVHYPIAMHQQPALKHLDYKEGDFPIAEAVSRRVLSLPMHPYMQESDQIQVAKALQKVLES